MKKEVVGGKYERQVLSNTKGREIRRGGKKQHSFAFVFFNCYNGSSNLFTVVEKENIFLTTAEENLTEFSCLPSPVSSGFSGRRIWGGFPPKWLQLFPQDQSDAVSVCVYFGSDFWLEPGRMTKFAVGLGTLDKHSRVSDFLTLNASWIQLLISSGKMSRLLGGFPIISQHLFSNKVNKFIFFSVKMNRGGGRINKCGL